VFAPLFVDTTKHKVWISAGSQLNYWKMTIYEVDLKNMNAYPLSFRYGSKRLDSLVHAPTHVKPLKGSYIIAEDNYGFFELKPGSRDTELLIPLAVSKGKIVTGDGIFFCGRGGGEGLNTTFKFAGDGRWIKVPHVFDSLNWTDVKYDSRNRSYWVCLRYEISL
jgi:hypothetical protein